MRLIESSHVPARRRAGTIASVAVHLVAIAGAVVATASANPTDKVSVPDEHLIYAPSPIATPTRNRGGSGAPAGPMTQTTARPPVVIGEIPPVDVGTEVGTGVGTEVDLAGPFERGLGGSGSGAPAGPPTGDPMPARYVDREVVALSPARPRYPEMLRAAGISGRVVVRFVVDTLGRVESGTPRVVEATHPAFADAALSAIPPLRFRPAEAAGHRVRQIVDLPFDFVIR